MPQRSKQPEKLTTQLGSLGWDRGRGRSDVRDDVPSRGWVEIKLTETPDTSPCTQAPVSWRKGDNTAKWLAVPEQREHEMRIRQRECICATQRGQP